MKAKQAVKQNDKYNDKQMSGRTYRQLNAKEKPMDDHIAKTAVQSRKKIIGEI